MSEWLPFICVILTFVVVILITELINTKDELKQSKARYEDVVDDVVKNMTSKLTPSLEQQLVGSQIQDFKNDLLFKSREALGGLFQAELLRIEQEVYGTSKANELEQMLAAAKEAVSKE